MNRDDAIETIFHREKKSILTFAIIILNALLFAVENTGEGLTASHMLELGAAFPPLIAEGQYWRLITALFLHGSLRHLGSNMLGLLFLGDAAESHIGKIRFLTLYLGGGVLGNLFSFWHASYVGEAVVSVGASTSVFALLGYLLVSFLKDSKRGTNTPVRRLLLYLVLALLSGFADPYIDGFAHLGGLVAGAILSLILIPSGNNTEPFWNT